MEPGDYFTNVLSFNNFACIEYEYFELQNTASGLARKHLQRLETAWRQRGILVHTDPFRDGIWMFHGSVPASNNGVRKDELLSMVDIQGNGLIQKEKGTYEPANLARNKQNLLSTTNTPSTSSSPSSSLENAFRNIQALNSRSAQTNAGLNMLQDPAPPSPGIKSATWSDTMPSLKDIHEYFISAVLGSIVYFLCRDHDFIPFNSRTLISSPSICEASGIERNTFHKAINAIELATLDIGLTSLGALVVKGHSDMAPGLQSLMENSAPESLLENISPGTPLWLAPGGNAARFHGISAKTAGSLPISQLQSSPGDQRANGFSSLSVKSWQSKCLDWLSTKGLNSAALESGGWLLVQVLSGQSPYIKSETSHNPILEDLAIVPWPALLCFQTTTPNNKDLQLIEAVGNPRDPLTFAEEWFSTREERTSVISKRLRDRQAQAAEALSREQAEVEARTLQANIFSPAALRRGSNAGAMYPTPPDAPQHQIGATPSFDGNVSTPGNPNMFIPHESVPNIGTGGSALDTDVWSSSGKKDRLNPGMNFNDTETDNDNLFGDLDFGTDITDADFSFFDEPDAIQLVPKSTPPNVAGPPAASGSLYLSESVSSKPAATATQLLSDVMAMDSVNSSRVPSNFSNEAPLGTRAKHEDSVNHQQLGNPSTILDRPAPLAPPPPISVPFNKESIFKILSQHQTFALPNRQPRRASLFNKIDFEKSVLSVNEKYGSHGQFKVSKERRASKSNKIAELPQTQYLKNRRKTHESSLEVYNIGNSVVDQSVIKQPKVDDPMEFLMDYEDTSPASEQDDTSHTTENPSPVQSGFGNKRKWDFDDRDDVTSSFDALGMDFEQTVSTPQSLNGSQLPFLDADPADWSLTTYFTSPEPDVQSSALSDLERIATAQILADQAASGTLQLLPSGGLEEGTQVTKASATRKLVHSLAKATKACLQDINTCTFRTFLEIQGLTVLTQGLRLPPRPNLNARGTNNIDVSRINNPFQIAPPQLEVRRSESKLVILPAAVKFWENLGLGPSKGYKDINAVCVYPTLEGVATYANIFLDQMRSVYESSRFGTHDRINGQDINNGLLPFSIDPQQQKKFHYSSVLKDTAARLSRALSSMLVEEKNFVVYFVYPVDDGALLVHICSAFQYLFNLYRQALSEHRLSPANELVLQLIPLEFIASPTSLAVPPPAECFRLAMEVYDRCMDFSSSSSTPAIMLEQPLPKSIDFKLNATPSASLLQENTCLHVAYAQSIDDRWITAAWTDNRGTQQMTASYCRGRKNEPLSMPFSDVANEIWQTTLDFISSKKIHWRIIIARVGVMDPSEIECWSGFAGPEPDAQVSLTLVTVQTDPSLRLLPPPAILLPNSSGVQPTTTPVSTPQTMQSSVMSPESATTPSREHAAATPVEAPIEPDSDSRLIDYTDQSWGAVLSHRLNNSNSLLDLNLALISGYLIKRGGTNNDDPPIIMEVNIVHTEVAGNPRTFHESLLREILGYYRGLGTLARIRGVVDPIRDVRPWHIAAAEKAVKTLYQLM